MNQPEQVEACPNCGKMAGWWSPVKSTSMVFFKPDGEKQEHRIFVNDKKRFCAECDHSISESIKNK